MRHGGGDGADADPLHDPEAKAEIHHVQPELLPAEVGLWPTESEHVAAAGVCKADHELVPGKLCECPVDDIQHRSARSVVVQQIGVEGSDGLSLCGDVTHCRCCRPGCVDPPIERHDEDGCHKGVWRSLQVVEGHGPSIVWPAHWPSGFHLSHRPGAEG